MQNNNEDRLKEILNHLSHWDFQFQGYDENGMPLVSAPNGQIVEINVAIKFVNSQIEKQQQTTSGGFENIQLSENLDQKVSVESHIETSAEKEKPSEDKKEETTKENAQSDEDLVVKKTSPTISLARPQKIKPYGDGFDPTSFDPSNIEESEKFIENNIKKSSTSSSKWLAIQFKKFVEENRSRNKK